MFKKIIIASVVILAFTSGAVFAETEQDLKKQMLYLRDKQDQIRGNYLGGVKALNNSTMEELSKLQKGDSAGRIKIMQGRKEKMAVLREKFKNDAASVRGEGDQLREKIATWKQSQKEEQQAKMKPAKKKEAPAKAQ